MSKKTKKEIVDQDPRKICEVCKGSGLESEDKKCPNCNGSGREGKLEVTSESVEE